MVGFTEGIGIGLLLACALFVLQAAGLRVVHMSVPGKLLHSGVWRGVNHEEALRTLRGSIHLLQLRGSLFFGTAHQLAAHVQPLLDAGELQYLVLDMDLLDAADSSALEVFRRLLVSGSDKQAALAAPTLLLCNVPQEIEYRLRAVGALPDESVAADSTVAAGSDCATTMLLTDLNEALEWCENQLLLQRSTSIDHFDASPLRTGTTTKTPSTAAASILVPTLIALCPTHAAEFAQIQSYFQLRTLKSGDGFLLLYAIHVRRAHENTLSCSILFHNFSIVNQGGAHP